MSCGKSTFALQTHYVAQQAGRRSLLFTKLDRDTGRISSRVGLSQPATVVSDDLDLYRHIADQLAAQLPVDQVICDEAQFFSPAQIDQLTMVVDELHVDVTALGLLTDFRSQLFPGSQRLIEVADVREQLQVQARCWCGQPAGYNARVINGVMQRDGDQVVVGDVGSGAVHYEVLCRPHYQAGCTTANADRCHLPAP